MEVVRGTTFTTPHRDPEARPAGAAAWHHGDMDVRRLDSAGLVAVAQVDVSEEDTVLLAQVGTDIVTTRQAWRRAPRDLDAWSPVIVEWRTILDAGGIAVGAFDGEALVGIAILRPDLGPGMAQLAALFTDRRHRRQGVATGLVRGVEAAARAAGATTLYVSASETPSAVGFYLGRGFLPTGEPHPDLLAREPLDIHMVKDFRHEP